MTASILDGKHVSSLLRTSIATHITQYTEKGTRPPCLAVILIGNDYASTLYVDNKRKACQAVGIRTLFHPLDDSIDEASLLALLRQLNQSPDVDSILVQLPLPKHIHSSVIIEHIHPDKDVDGFHPRNLGRLAQGNPGLRPCTPLGIMHLLNHYNIPLAGCSALVVGASNIVGRPMALELLNADATVTIAHSKTKDLKPLISQADLIISATGVAQLIHPDWLREHQIIVDVGIHRTPEQQIKGDIDFEQAKDRVAWITPVPGGVGPMTIAMLLKNTLQCWLRSEP